MKINVYMLKMDGLRSEPAHLLSTKNTEINMGGPYLFTREMVDYLAPRDENKGELC